MFSCQNFWIWKEAKTYATVAKKPNKHCYFLERLIGIWAFWIHISLISLMWTISLSDKGFIPILTDVMLKVFHHQSLALEQSKECCDFLNIGPALNKDILVMLT